jgi:hypothetical protein
MCLAHSKCFLLTSYFPSLSGYHSGGILSWRKSGDTGGYSSRVSYSALKGRAALAVDTCGGCGSQGTAGSGAQRAALLLSDGPPTVVTALERQGTQDSTSNADMVFTGDALSHNFPSVAQINIEVTTSDNIAVIALSSSAGAGALTNDAQNVGGGKWVITEPIFMGTGWGATNDPFTQLDIQRSLIIAQDGKTAIYQDMGADTSLALVTMDSNDEQNEAAEENPVAGVSTFSVFSALSLVVAHSTLGMF